MKYGSDSWITPGSMNKTKSSSRRNSTGCWTHCFLKTFLEPRVNAIPEEIIEIRNRELSPKGKEQLAQWHKDNNEREGPCDPEYKFCMSKTTGDCAHLTSALSWWCINDDARKYRGTTIPNIYNCPFYEEREGIIKKHIPIQVEILDSFFWIFKAIFYGGIAVLFFAAIFWIIYYACGGAQ
jgi:hypothetical protein